MIEEVNPICGAFVEKLDENGCSVVHCRKRRDAPPEYPHKCALRSLRASSKKGQVKIIEGNCLYKKPKK